MKLLLASASIFALAAFTVPASAGLLAGSGNPAAGGGGGACPNDAAAITHGFSSGFDGCDAALAGIIQHPTFFTGYANQNGQSYAARPVWNVAGVEYGVGQVTADGSLLDPTNNANLPSGCTWDAADNWVDCTGSGTITIQHLYFNDHRLYIHGSYSSITLFDNDFKNGPNVDATSGDLIRIDDEGRATAWIVKNNTLNGNGRTYFKIATVVNDNRTNAGSTTSYTYNAFLHLGGKGFEMAGCSDPNVNYNYIEDFPFPTGNGIHSELQLLGVCTFPTYTETFNTALLPNDTPSGGWTVGGGPTTIDYISNGSPGPVFTLVSHKYNVAVTNKIPVVGGSPSHPTASILNFQDATYTTVNVVEDWWDPNGTVFCASTGGTVTITTITFTGVIDMYDNSTLTGLDSPHCPGSNL